MIQKYGRIPTLVFLGQFAPRHCGGEDHNRCGPEVSCERRPVGPGAGSPSPFDEFDVTPDGQFLFVRRPDSRASGNLILVQNFCEELKRLVPN